MYTEGPSSPFSSSTQLPEEFWLSVDQESNSEFRRALIAIKARINPKEKFNNLLHHLTPELVRECLAKMPLKFAPRVDGMTVSQAENNLNWLLPPQLDAIHKGKYEAPPVRRVYISKGTNGKRPIGVPRKVLLAAVPVQERPERLYELEGDG